MVQISKKIFGVNTIYRKRKFKTRYGFHKGSVFNGVHFWKVSFYWEKLNPVRNMNVSIKDV